MSVACREQLSPPAVPRLCAQEGRPVISRGGSTCFRNSAIYHEGYLRLHLLPRHSLQGVGGPKSAAPRVRELWDGRVLRWV